MFTSTYIFLNRGRVHPLLACLPGILSTAVGVWLGGAGLCIYIYIYLVHTHLYVYEYTHSVLDRER